MKESSIQQAVRLALSQAGAVMFRNNQGKYQDDRGRWITYGICNPGGSDLIGWTPLTITPDMVGQKVAVFTAVEVKTPTGKATPAQLNFIDQVQQAGGLAMIVRSAQDTALLYKKPLG